MANKQVVSSFQKCANLCEINKEYPYLNKSAPARHLNTNFEPLKSHDNTNIEKLLNKIASQNQGKDSNNKQPKPVKEQTEVIELFHEEINKKLYRKSRNQMRDRTDSEYDNTNES